MSLSLFSAFGPDTEKLTRVIAPLIDDGMLAEIALADYGRNQEQHLNELVKIRNGQMLPAPMPWHPAEVLELVRWSEPDDPKWKPGRFGVEGHWMRAFVCTALLREAQNTGNADFRGSWDSTSVQLVESLRVLERFHRPAISLLASLMDRFASDSTDQVAILGYALLGLAITPEAGFADDSLLALHAWCETRGRQEWQEDQRDVTEDWLVVSINKCQCKNTWQRLAERLANDLEGRSETLQTAVLSVASRLCGS
jgi:hypothetical protein